ncbi:MAG: PAS domain-containing protein [Casimicrobiaceae bacterium]
MRASLKIKAAAAITLLFVGMMALLASVQTRSIRAELVAEVADQQATLMAHAARDLDRKLDLNLRALTGEALAIPPEVLARPEQYQNYLEHQSSMLLLFDALLIFSPTGEVLADAPYLAGRKGINAADREYFKRSVATGKPVISVPYVGRAAQRPIVTMMAPILDADGRLVGFLGGHLQLLDPNFLGGLTAGGIGRTGYFFVITKSVPSVYVVHPDRTLILQSSIGAVPTNERALSGHEGTFEGTDGHGVPGLFSYKSLAATNWLLAANYPLAEALAPVAAAQRQLWVVTAVLATLLAPLVWLLTWYLIAPLLRLHEDVHRLRLGTGTISAELQSRQDEIGDLARDFDLLIADRQRNADAVKESTRLLDNIVENMPVAIQLKDVRDDYRFVMWNKAAGSMYGFARQDVIGRTVNESWTPEEIARYRAADELAVASGGQDFPNRIAITAGRGTISVHLRKVPLLDAGGVATHLLVIADDVTDRVAADARLAASEARFRGAAESALDALFVLESVRDAAGAICDFRFSYLNTNAERLVEKPAGQLLGQLLCEVFPSQRAHGHFAKYAAVVTTGVPMDEEYRSSDIGLRPAWLHHQVVRLEDGIAVTTRDISARKASEEELRSSRGFLKSLIDNLPMAIYVKDVRPASFGDMVVWNKGAEVIGGIPEAEAIGRKDKEIFAPDIYREIEAHDRALLESPMVSDEPEHPFRRADGKLAFLHTISVPLFGSDDTPEFILRISEDVTARRREQRELRARTAELFAVTDASPLGMFRTDPAGRNTYVNRSYELLSGARADEALADGWTAALHVGDRARVEQQWAAAVREGQPFASQFRYRHQDGRIVWASVRAAPIMLDGRVSGYAGTADDITARHNAEHALEASERRLRTITDTMPAWIAYVDRQEVYQFTNAAFERAYSMTREQVRGRAIREVVGEAVYAFLKPYLMQAFSGKTVTFEREETVGDAVRWIGVTYIPQAGEDNEEVVGIHAMLRDITIQKLEESRLVRLSQVDSLTGLSNRVGFEQRLADAMAESRTTGQALAVMYLDIDHFKQINDVHGHATGDALLIAFAQRLKGSLRKTDMVARLGGDEFVVVMERILEPRNAARLATKTLSEILRPFELAGHSVPMEISASIGIAFFGGGPGTADQLVAEADALLYSAKRGGRNTFRLASWPPGTVAGDARLH